MSELDENATMDSMLQSAEKRYMTRCAQNRVDVARAFVGIRAPKLIIYGNTTKDVID